MGKLIINTDPKIEKVFQKYPDPIRSKMQFLRKLVLETAQETPGIDKLVETLKWGEPSFITKIGSTLRIDWKEKNPNQYALYFQCTSRLVETFKLEFGSTFQYEGNRAILLNINQKLPVRKLKKCIRATLSYHKVKHLITLGL